MREYRVPELDLATRIQIAAEMMQPAQVRGWGWVTERAQAYGVSRQLLYDIRDKAEDALAEVLRAGKPGPTAVEEGLVLDRDYLQRAIAVLATIPGSVRGIQMGLQLLFDVERREPFRARLHQRDAAASWQGSGAPEPDVDGVREPFRARFWLKRMSLSGAQALPDRGGWREPSGRLSSPQPSAS